MSDFFRTTEAVAGPVECLGQTFPSDDVRRAHFLALLAEKLKDPALINATKSGFLEFLEPAAFFGGFVYGVRRQNGDLARFQALNLDPVNAAAEQGPSPQGIGTFRHDVVAVGIELCARSKGVHFAGRMDADDGPRRGRRCR